MPKRFPRLDLDKLKIYTEEWIDNIRRQFPSIRVERILLYEYRKGGQKSKDSERGGGVDTFRRKVDGKWPIPEYIIVFEFSGCDDIDPESVQSLPNDHYTECENFLSSVKFAGRFNTSYPFIDEAFESEVYKRKSCQGIKNDWVFMPVNLENTINFKFTKKPKNEEPDYRKKRSAEGEEFIEPIEADIIDLISEGPGVVLYTAGGEKGAKGEAIDYATERWGAGKLLKHGDFREGADKKLTAIARKYGLKHTDSLRKHVRDAGLLARSKPGPKSRE